MKQYQWTRLAAAAGLVVLLTSGCSLLESKNQSLQIDPPQTTGMEAVPTSGKATVQTIANPMQITIYAKDEKGFVAPIALQVEKTESTARRALEYMVDGGAVQGQLPAGFTSLLPKGTEVKDIDINKEQKLATVDFSKMFNDYNLADERKILEGLTWTLTNFPSVEKVRIRVEGKAITEMPVGGTPVDDTLTRAMGINLEKPDGVEYGQSTPVTLYFLNQNQEEFNYYVPVTRLVKRTDQIDEAVVEQLIAGPDQKKGLTAVMQGAQLLKVSRADDLITVNFSESMLGKDKKAPAEALKAVVLSLTENAGAGAKVQILVNGEAKVSASDNQNYAKPVARPAAVNPLKL
ncbi:MULTISPECIES: GerMN domain-containing protein [Paenibacillus]|uniref:GerMN domain-containing protein n=1 Tax=Paenibacillus TaxID=44249 RepID=UPI0022B8A956|nr:GerMN domain-containing protein [Paenibacillus caseinilyticus]MCZ8519132.1 GerMN domain-containing protein [Paenibacillus caseinilyticus]